MFKNKYTNQPHKFNVVEFDWFIVYFDLFKIIMMNLSLNYRNSYIMPFL